MVMLLHILLLFNASQLNMQLIVSITNTRVMNRIIKSIGVALISTSDGTLKVSRVDSTEQVDFSRPWIIDFAESKVEKAIIH